MPSLAPKISEIQQGNWLSAVNFSRDVQKALHKLASFKLGPGSSPSYGTVTLTDLTANRLVQTDASKTLSSITNLTSWIAGTANEINVADDGDGTVTISIVDPLIVSKGGTGVTTLTDHGILLGSGTDPITALGSATNGQLPIGSTGVDPVLAALTQGTGITVTNGAGSISIAVNTSGINHNSLSGLQGGTTAEYYHLTNTEHSYVSGINAQSVLTTASPTFANVYVPDDGTVGISGGVILTFDDTADALSLTGSTKFSIGAVYLSTYAVENGMQFTAPTGFGTGLTLRTETDKSGYLLFADGASGAATYAGAVAYSHSTDTMTFNTASVQRASLSSTGLVITSAIRANTTFNLNGTDGVTQTAGSPSSITTAGGIVTAITVNGTPTYSGVLPLTDDTYYLGKNDDDTPAAWKGVILRDQAGTGKYYRIEVYNDALRIVDLTD